MSWHALFAKEHTEQLLWASIIRKCNKIRQTDYISELGSKIKTQFGKGFNYGACACLYESAIKPLYSSNDYAQVCCAYAYECIKQEPGNVFYPIPAFALMLYHYFYSCLQVSGLVGGRLLLLVVGGRAQPVATYTGFQPAIDTNLVLAKGCSNHFRHCCQLVSNRG